MGKLIYKNEIYSGSSNNAAAINYIDKNGNKTTVQDKIEELDKQNQILGGFTPVIDETGKITGYTTSVGGADTVFPFSEGGKEKLYNALRYSNFGLTEDMTFDEMCDVLARLYPAELNLLTSDYFTADSFITIGEDYVQFTNNGGTAVTTTKYSNFIRNKFNTLTVAGRWGITTDSSVTSTLTMTLENESGGTIATLLSASLSGDSNSKSADFSQTVDLKDYMDKNIRIKVVMYHRYQDRDYIKLTTLKLS